MRCRIPTTSKTPCAVSLAVAAALIAPAAFAQNSILDEITVTAQKREQTLEEVPLAVNAISGEQVSEYIQGGGDIRSLAARVPGLNIETSNGRTQPRIYLRGFGNPDFDVNAQQPVAYVFDEIALNNPTLRSLPLFDLARIEVLKGPQGSLFGRNTN
ncbi:MAG: Plug domain-containing protein, partial [Pseudomonadota bacterium]